MRIGLIVIATGKYDRFVDDLWTSARQHFLAAHSRHLYLFTDRPTAFPDCSCYPTRHEPWPGPTLHRYRSFLAHELHFGEVDYLFMCDADMRFVGTVGDEILGDVVATIHPGFFSQPADGCSFDRNPNSRAFVRPGTGRRYYAGGFQGGRTEHYMAAVQTIAGRIDEDEANGVMALWHDESHWNRYLVDQPPMVELSPAYCYPEGWRLPFEQRLLALNKNHGELRT